MSWGVSEDRSDQFIGSIDGTRRFTRFGAKLDCWMNIQNQDCHAKKKHKKKKQQGTCNEDDKKETTNSNNSKDRDRMIEDDDSCDMFWCSLKHWCKPQRRKGRIVETSRAHKSTRYCSSASFAKKGTWWLLCDSWFLFACRRIWSLCLSGFTRRYSQRRAGCGLCRHLPRFFRCLALTSNGLIWWTLVQIRNV